MLLGMSRLSFHCFDKGVGYALWIDAPPEQIRMGRKNCMEAIISVSHCDTCLSFCYRGSREGKGDMYRFDYHPAVFGGLSFGLRRRNIS